MYAIGTSLKTIIDIPDIFKTIQLDKMKQCLDLQTQCFGYFAEGQCSSCHTDLAFEETRNRKRKLEEVRKPKVITDYKNGMFGVDRMDQQLACFPIMRRPLKAYKNICFYLLNLAIYNSFAFYNKVRPPKPK